MKEKPKYVIGEHIICLTLPESCLIVEVDELREFYRIFWLMKPEDGLEDERLSFYVAHKYFKQMHKVKKREITWLDSKSVTS